MFKKILFIMFISLISIGVVAAADVGNFNVPKGFDDLGSGVFIFQSLKDHDQYLTIVPFNNHYKADYLINDSSDGYFIFLYKNNTFNYVEKSVNEQGSFEIIEVDGKKYIIDFYWRLERKRYNKELMNSTYIQWQLAVIQKIYGELVQKFCQEKGISKNEFHITRLEFSASEGENR
mgnify:CR=1 FL=1